MSEYSGFPQGVVGTIARNSISRPSKLRMKGSGFGATNSTVSAGGSRGSRSRGATRRRGR